MSIALAQATSEEPASWTPPLPLDIASTGLSQSMLEELLARKLMELGAVDIRTLVEHLKLASKLLEELIMLMRADARVESHSPGSDSTQLRYGLTEAGRQFALEARERSAYTGPAPVSASFYQQLIKQQSANDTVVNREAMQRVYHDVILDQELMDCLGAAMNSGRAMFVYGAAGTGKTYICKRLVQLLDGYIYIPWSVAVGESIVNVYDPAIHEAVEVESSDSAFLSDLPDPRLVLCKRPFVCSGGELTADMLEISFDTQTRQFNAPLQLKATHGIFMIDDLGRQKMPTGELFNRWIVPMESREDYLGLPSGQRLLLPFDVLLVFSTNLNPDDLEDPAFQRRVGHKIRFRPVSSEVFSALWAEECRRRGVDCDPALVEFVLKECFAKSNQALLASQPRDLIGMALDFSLYADNTASITQAALQLAWDNYRCAAGESQVNL